MHSSRMRTGRSLTVCCSLLPGGVCLVRGVFPGWGGGLPVQGGVCLFQGGFSLLGGSAWSGVYLVLGGLPGRGGLPGPGGSAWSQGGSAWSRGPGVGVSAWSWGAAWRTPPVDRITDMCKNITLATTSLRPVITFTFDKTHN